MELKWHEKENELFIKWQDGHETRLSLLYLRKNCPCALCREKREVITKEVQAKDIVPVGNYALRIIWSDGHSTGIYSFEMLRKLDYNSTSL